MQRRRQQEPKPLSPFPPLVSAGVRGSEGVNAVIVVFIIFMGLAC